ncbi:hypothetical protein Areg01_45310 [Actinoplanes regularis]|nr:hypothetical protein Areg01_45310 [Actinoplanes regularis]
MGMVRDTTELGFSAPDRVLVTCGPAVCGLLLTAALPAAARWLLDLHIGLPFGPVFRVLSRIDSPWELAIQAAILVVVGLCVTASLYEHLTPVTVGPDQLRAGPVRLSRAEIAAVYLDGDTLVVLDRESRQAVRCIPRARRRLVAGTFHELGYPWQDTDPFAHLYQPWPAASGVLPDAADAVLSARAVALRKKAAREATELRATLEKLGYSVRDDRDRQLWRPLVRS